MTTCATGAKPPAMPKKRATSRLVPTDLCFVNDLAGEAPPTFAAICRLYELASKLFSLRAWQFLDESQLIAVRDSRNGEFCFCSVMGALGEVYAMHGYLGSEGLRAFRRLEAEELTEPGEFFAIMRSVYVEFVPRSELEKQDRELLEMLDHPTGRNVPAPMFRAIRPGFQPWFVTAAEAHTLAECLHAVIVVASAAASQKKVRFWDKADTYPIVTRVEGTEPRDKIDLLEIRLPPAPTIPPASLDEKSLEALRGHDHAVRGTMELDHIFSGTPIGKKNERKACASIALAVDAGSGVVYAPEITDARVARADILARVFVNAVQSSRTLPQEVRVRSQALKDSLAPLMQSFGIKVRVAKQLPATDLARAHLLNFLVGRQ